MWTKPMLAASLLPPSVEHTDEMVLDAMKKLKYPVIATSKEDGIRGLRRNRFVSRTLKLIPNESIRERAMRMPYGFDVEIGNRNLMYNEVESIVMSKQHPNEGCICFYVLDWFSDVAGYSERLLALTSWWIKNPYADIVPLTGKVCHTPEELLAFEKQTIEDGGEGICFRLPDSPYKEGRSTLAEQYLVKLARYVRSECTIIDLIEQEQNLNRIKYNSVGLMARSKSKAGMVGKNTLGAFLVRDSDGLCFRVGSGVGLTAELRKEIWSNQDKYIGRQIVIKHKQHGKLIRPRSPIFVGFREEGF